jgi:ribonuclease III
LEFLGDSVLELVVTRALFERFVDLSEGQLTQLRAKIVSRESCAAVAERLELDERLGPQAPDVAESRNVLAAVIEAAIGGLFLTHGFEKIEDAVVEAFESQFSEALRQPLDAKTELQEALARNGRKVRYDVEREGPVHDAIFTAFAVVDGERLGAGSGRTKKDAEQAAAREALEGIRSAQ